LIDTIQRSKVFWPGPVRYGRWRDGARGWLKRSYGDDEAFQVSHETIYKSLFIQARGALKKELLRHPRKTRAMHRSRHKTLKGEGLGQITDTVAIRERPAEAEDRAVPGHWEGDLLFGSNNSQIATLVERHTRYVMLVRVKSKDTETVINALIKHAHKLPRELYKSLTWDRGSEMADHPRFSLATDIKAYFCDPQSVAARLEREHQRSAQAILSQRNGSLKRAPEQTECRGQTTQ
jgi:IS30 family transposase